MSSPPGHSFNPQPQDLMKKQLLSLTLTATLGLLTSTASAATLVDFSAAEGFTTGNLQGQEDWNFVFGQNPSAFSVDTSGSGTMDFSTTTGSGALRRTFTAGEAGEVFNPTSTIVTYAFVIDDITPGSFNNGMTFSIGGAGAGADVALNFRGDGFLTVNDGITTGNARILGGFDALDPGTTITITLDFDTTTFDIVRSDTGASFINRAFATDGSTPYELRLDGASGANLPISFDSVSIAAVPEPTSAAMLLSALSLLALRSRGRRS